ncbi:MAG: hypothetical protein HZA48_12090 [Planctomycetes bacterium]|nr:hypothetical protein [Planctomycetota bacterium]
MSKSYTDILTTPEKKEFYKLAKFAEIGLLSGGTALALQFQHRRSYDFDIFLSKPVPANLARTARNTFGRILIINDSKEELSFTTKARLKITFLHFPFPRLYAQFRLSPIGIAHWKDIVLDKAYALGKRAQYRDYVDLFFSFRMKKIKLEWLISNAKRKFGDLFPDKLFLQQLAYSKDISLAPVEYIQDSHSPAEIFGFFAALAEQFVKKKL